MSKTRFIGMMAMLAVVIILMTGCGADPVTVAQQFQEAFNSQNVESVLELLAENASLTVDETSSFTGKEQIADWLATQAELRFQFNGDPIVSESGVTFENCSISSYQWSYYGIKAMSGTCDVAVEGGLVSEFAVQFDEISKASLSDSSVATSTDLVGIWTAEGVLPGGNPHEEGGLTKYYLQFNEDGSARLAVTPDDLLATPDPDHPGARYKWRYEGYLLTVQNDGPGSDGFCLAQDVGTYLTRNVESVSGKRMQFKLISDSCVFRSRNLPRIAAPWDAYLP
jgi:hypothetical protein